METMVSALSSLLRKSTANLAEICVPSPPLLTSAATQWRTISMTYMHQPTHEFPEICLPAPFIAICTASALTERTIDGTSKMDSIQTGDIVVVPANVGHGVRWTGEVGILLIGLDPALFIEAIDGSTNLKPTQLIPHFATPDPLVNQLGLSLKTVLEQNPTNSRLYAETIATMLTVHLLQNYSQHQIEFKDYATGLSRSKLCQVIEYIQANLDQELGLAELAAIANLSPHYFTRLFKQSTKLTPHQFVIRCRVERAKMLLLAGEHSIAEIAQKVGFANQAHLNVHIKRVLGVTPKVILEQRKNR
jgi:AraC family transcriptional regulator